MTKYDLIADAIQTRVDTGELSLEDAETLNDMAYEKYADEEVEGDEVEEGAEDITLGDVVQYIESAIGLIGEDEVIEESAIDEDGIDALKLAVVQAFESGEISRNDRDSYLELLNLENYE